MVKILKKHKGEKPYLPLKNNIVSMVPFTEFQHFFCGLGV
jgi:hypothetical protein